MKDDVERGGIIEKGLEKQKTEELVVVSEMATDIVCIRFLNWKVAVHFCPLLKVRFSS